MMSTTQNDFRRLNALRKLVGKPELKAWKESKAKLTEQINILQAQVAPKDTTQYFKASGEPAPITVCPPSPELVALEKRRKAIDEVVQRRLAGVDVVTPPAPGTTAKLGDAAKVKKTQQTSTTTGDTVKLADICREIGMDPKIARAKLRRTMTPPNITVGKYVYKTEGKNLVIAVLRGGKV